MPLRSMALVLLMLFVQSCRTTRFLPEGQVLLQKNKIILKSSPLEKGELKAVLKHQPNRKLLGFYPFFLYMYNFGQRFPASKVGKWISNSIGEQPVALDSLGLRTSTKALGQYLANRGYLDYEVKDSVKYSKRRKAKVYYTIEPGQPYRLDKVRVSVEDEGILQDFIEANRKTMIRQGAIFDLREFENDRARLVRNMRNKGYYYFSPENIVYQLDTAGMDHEVKVKQVIQKRRIVQGDSSYFEAHKKYKWSSIFVGDTLYSRNEATGLAVDIQLAREISPSFLGQNIFMRSDSLYRLDDVNYTYNRMFPMRIFRKVDVEVTDVSVPEDSIGLLDAEVHLPFLPSNAFSAELNGTHRGGNLGISTNLSLQNKNTFGHGEILEFKLLMGLESQPNQGGSDILGSEQVTAGVFNTLNYGGDISLINPRLLVPFIDVSSYKIYNPKTVFTTSYHYQRNPGFERNIAGFHWRYAWSISKRKHYSLSPIEFNVVRIPSDDFKEDIRALNNPFLSNTYQDHLLLGSRLQYYFTSKEPSPRTNYFSYKIGLESVGSSLALLYEQINDVGLDSVQGEFFGIQFAHFLRTDFDFRLHTVLSKYSELVYRFYTGFGLPLENSATLPFEKSFFGGGANGVRAWQIRELGPGGFMDDNASNFYRVGDIQMEANAELRFDITSMIEGALFVDAGNIWLYNKDTTRANGEFAWDRFHKELAVGAGAGLRFDFNFFLIRFDWGLQLRDPALAEGERWFFQDKPQYFISRGKAYKAGYNFNIGIGYPF